MKLLFKIETCRLIDLSTQEHPDAKTTMYYTQNIVANYLEDAIVKCKKNIKKDSIILSGNFLQIIDLE